MMKINSVQSSLYLNAANINNAGIKKQPALHLVQNPKVLPFRGMYYSSLGAGGYNSEELIKKSEELKTRHSFLENIYDKKKEPNIINFLIKTGAPPKENLTFLYSLTKNPDTAAELAEQFVKNPEKTGKIYKTLKELLCTNERHTQLFYTWLNDEESGYKKAYSEYYFKKFDNAENLEELVKISPNIAPWAISGKASQLGKEFTLGKLPEEFGTSDDFKELIKDIKNSEFFKAFRPENFDIKKEEEKIAEEYGLDRSNTIEITKLLNRKFAQAAKKPIKSRNGLTLQPLVQSFSSKLIFKVTAPNNEVYFIKMDPDRPDSSDKSDRARKIKENSDLRPDMPYLNAMIDFYLKLNNAEQAPDIKFYDHETNTVIYKSTEGEEPKDIFSKKIKRNLYLLHQNAAIQSLHKFGLKLNDIHTGNFLKTPEGGLVLIDSGHAYFSDPLRPALIGQHITIGSLCGNECIDGRD